MTSNAGAQAAKDILQEVIKVAAEEGRLEEERLGRPLTEAEAGRLASMILRQFNTALLLGR